MPLTFIWVNSRFLIGNNLKLKIRQSSKANLFEDLSDNEYDSDDSNRPSKKRNAKMTTNFSSPFKPKPNESQANKAELSSKLKLTDNHVKLTKLKREIHSQKKSWEEIIEDTKLKLKEKKRIEYLILKTREELDELSSEDSDEVDADHIKVDFK